MISNTKKWAALGAVVLVLGIGAAVFMQQTTARVEAEVRAALAGLPGLTEHSVDRVKYDFFTHTLTLKNLHMVFKDKDNTTDVSMAEVVAVKPNPHALRGGEAGTLLAEEVRVTKYVASATTATPPTKAESRLDSMRFTKPEADIPGLMNLTLVNGKPVDAAKGLKALSSLKAASLQYTGMSVDVTVPDVPPLRMTLDSMEIRDVTIAYTGAGTLKNWVLDVQGMGKASLGSLEISALSLPDLSKLPPELLNVDNDDENAEALAEAFKKAMPKDKPLLDNLTLRDVKESFSGGNMSLQRLSVDNFWYEPMQGGLVLEGLSVPAQLMPSPVIAMLGYKHLNMSGDVSLRPVKNKMLQLTATMDTQDAGKMQLTMDMKDPLSGPTSLHNIDILLLESLKLSYLDKGLAGRGMRLAQSTMNWGPEMVVGLARASAAEIVGNNPENIKQLTNFVEKPGEITLVIKPTKPTPMGRFEQLLEDTTALHVTSVPGPKTLQELAK